MVKLLFINELKQDQSCGLNILETFVKFNIKFMDIREQLGFCIIEKHKVFDTRLILYCNQSLLLVTAWKSKNFLVLVVLTVILVYSTSIKCQRISM